jgi:two-component system, NtrC family, sensor kinase
MQDVMRTSLRQAAVSVWAVLAMSAVLVGLLIATVLSYRDRDLAVTVGLIGAIGLLASIGAGELAGHAQALRDARAELTTRNARLEGMFMAAKIGMALTDREGRWVLVNPALCSMLGYSRDELEGRHFLEITHPGDRVESERAFEPVRDGKRNDAEVEKRYVARDGSAILVKITASAFGDWIDGRRVQVAQIENITARRRAEEELRRSEERWRTLLAEVREIVTLVDADGRISYVSPSLKRWLGYEPELVIGHDIVEGTHREDVPVLADALARCTPAQPMSLSRRVMASDGSWRTMESTIVSLRDDSRVGALLITSRDVTDRVALEQERERLDLDRRVSQRLEAVGQLASGIAHEINTPLQFVGDSVAFLREATDELLKLAGLYRETLYGDAPVPVEERRRKMREAEADADIDYLCERIPVATQRTLDGIERVRSIVQAMKRFSHDSGTAFAPADLNDALETTLAVSRNEYKYVADVVTEFGELPPVECNIGELNQVFLNLVLNAAQAIQDHVGNSGERGTIRIGTRLEGSEVVVEIADDGPGIPVELQERIYEPFFTTKEVGRGTGQGLALARSTIDRHAGLLQCSSVPGAGATFTIRLPVRSETQPLAEAA